MHPYLRFTPRLRRIPLGMPAWVRHQPRATAAIAAIIITFGGSAAAIVLEAGVRARLDGAVYRAPTRFFARPVVFYPGMRLDPDEVEQTLQRLGYRRTRRRSVEIGEYRIGSRELVIGRRAFRHYDRFDPGGIATVRLGWNERVSDAYDEDGRRVRYVALEPEQLGTGHGAAEEDRIPIPLRDAPGDLIDAILSIEDRHFFEHDGLDLRRVAGAMLANLRARRVVQGASTITQQLAKNLFLSSRRSPVRKVREMAMAIWLEDRYTKEQILEAYLNQVYLGQDGGLAIHGVGRAAQHYFAKDVSRLDLHEAALLAGIIRGPSLYAPFRNPQTATRRRDLVLRAMLERGVITEGEYEEALDQPLDLRERPPSVRRGRYFLDYVAGQLPANPGLAVFTTLDMGLQRQAEEALEQGLARLERDYPQLVGDGTPVQAALVALNPHTGEILAMVGGRDYGQSQFNRAVHAQRQPGSSFKPIVALAALAWPKGDRRHEDPAFNLASVLRDEPLSVETPAGLWQPVNYDGRFRGPITLRDALERSLNVPFARLGMAVGPEKIVETAHRLGIEGRLNAVPSLALGASEVTPLELTRAYGVLAAGGFRADLHAMLGVLDTEGNVLDQMEVTGKQVYTPAETYLVTSALRGAVERGTGRALRAMGYRGAVAAKSGTSSNFRDGWFVGYTPTLAVGVWVGFDDGRGLGVPGSRVALPIFARFLAGVPRTYREDEFEYPSGLEVVEVNRETGLRAGPGCRGERELFLPGTAPRESCGYWSSRRFSNSRSYESVRRLLRDLIRSERRRE